ncbi:IclR family transcriptional regulator [Sulfitobacter aestuarii]|uniref:IclR family transcriptional regulator n=1 Tax=Sulfitobacter aestuarii TaxID=2161676 RepID=A0ABW5U705_9RHOB
METDMQSEPENVENEVGTSTVGKAFQIISAVTAAPNHHATVAEISEKLALPRPTANRLISNLIKLGLLKREGGGLRIIEGDRLVQMSSAVLEGAARRGPRHEVLRQLVIETRETANVGTLSDGEVLYLDRFEAVWPLALRLEVGSRVPIYCSAIGKLMLSRMPPTQRRKFLDALVLTPRTENTITSRDVLEGELDNIANTGFAVDDEECFNGVIGIAVAVESQHAIPNLGLSLVAPSGRQTIAQMQGFLPALQAAAVRLAHCYTT